MSLPIVDSDLRLLTKLVATYNWKDEDENYSVARGVAESIIGFGFYRNQKGTKEIVPDATEQDEAEEDNDGVEQVVVTKTRPPKSSPLSSKLPVVHSGEEECFWCSRVLDKSKMKRITMAGLPAYKCERC